MRFVAASCAAIAFSLAGAQAADLAVMPTKALPVEAPPGWTGFYVGGEAGLRSTNAHWSLSNLQQNITVGGVPGPITQVPLLNLFGTDQPINSSAGRFGGYFGYNWQVAPRIVVGVEGDVAWSDKTTTLSGFAFMGLTNGFPAGGDISLRTTWDASLRARVGLLATSTTLLYVTGGPAWQRVEARSQCLVTAPLGNCSGTPSFNPFAFGTASVLPGATVGAGIETMLGGNWLARAEYRYAAYKSLDLSGSYSVQPVPGLAFTTTFFPSYHITTNTNTFSFGLAYQFGGGDRMPAMAATPATFAKATPQGSWSGLYAGLDAGFRASRADLTTVSATAAGVPVTGIPSSTPLDGTAGRIGLYLGRDWQFAPRWVAGIEGDWGVGNRRTTLNGVTFTPGPTLSLDLAGDTFALQTRWDASIRGRIGYLVRPDILVYATGGVAWQNYNVTSTCAEVITSGGCIFGTPQVIASSVTKAGATIGGGIEARLERNWFVRGEYRYADFGTDSFQLTRTIGGITDNFSIQMHTHTALLGVAYKFADWPVLGR
jgi:outer membrane immunogenic protein